MLPNVRAERSTAAQAHANALDLLLAERLVDECQPVVRYGRGPARQDVGRGPRPVASAGQARPPPQLGTIHQARPQRVALDIPRDRQEVMIRFNWKRLETILVNVSSPGGVPIRMPASSVGHGKPPKEVRKLVILCWPDEGVPVIGHDAVRAQADIQPRHGLSEHLLERMVVGLSVKDSGACVRAVEDVVRDSASSNAPGSRHR